MKKIFLLLSALMAITGCNESETSSFSKNDIEKIKQTMLEYREAWKTGDSTIVLSMVCEDMILYMPDKIGKPKIGKDSIRAFWFPPSDVSYPITAYEVTDEKIEGSGNLCFYSGISKLTWHILKGNVHSDTTTSVSEFLNVLKKEKEEWKLYRVMYNLKAEDYN
jgi:ketosteroid isomerase-like protein